MKIKVSVVIPNYNGEKYLSNCLKSLKRQSFKDFEIIVVDDGSKDGSAKRARYRIRKEGGYPPVHFLMLRRNTGFAAAVNAGIKKSAAPLVLLLNNDTIAEKHFVEKMYMAMRCNPGVFSASAKMLNMHNRRLADDCGDMYCALGYAFSPAKDKPAEAFRRSTYVFAACAGAAIYRKDDLELLGGFDELHFAYLEDIDLGYRARLAGFKNIYAPGAKVLHAGSGFSGSRYNEFKVALSSRNNVYLIYKNMPVWQLIVNAPFLIAGFAVKAVFFAAKGLGGTYTKGLAEGIRMSKGPGRNRRVDFSRVPGHIQLRTEAELLRNMLRLL